MLGGAVSASPASFQRSPREFDVLANKALKQVDADLRFRLMRCEGRGDMECYYSSPNIAALVQGRSDPPRIGRIRLEADLLQDRPGADAVVAVTDAVLALGAAVVSFDPRLPAKRRVELISTLTNEALDRGRSEAIGLDARYVATFDEEANGRLLLTVTPAE